MEDKVLGISYGVMSPSISSQIKKQGLRYDAIPIKKFEKNRWSIQDLRFSGMLTDSQSSKLFSKLHNKVMKSVARTNKVKIK